MKKITNSRSVFDLVSPLLADEENENLILVTLNAAMVVKSIHWLTSGSDVATIISSKQVTRAALMDNAVCTVLVHNHPSGNTSPSAQDISQTERVRDALKLYDIALCDHVIIGNNSYYSFTEEKTTTL